MKLKLNRTAIRLLLVLLAAAVVLAALLHFIRIWDHKQYQVDVPARTLSPGDLYAGEDEAMTYLGGKWYVARDGIETILLLGLDKFEDALPAESSYVNHQQADFLLLFVLDHADQTYTTLHLNRDSMAEMQVIGVDGKSAGTTTAQLALAHTYGSGKDDSCRYTAEAVSGYLYGAQIDHYISLTMDAVAEVNDLAGGVTLTVQDDLTPVDETLVKDTSVTLTGAQALTYVRARGGLEDSSNIRRMERQRQYLHALHEQIVQKMAESDDFLPDAIFTLSPYLVSDCTANQLSDIGNSLLEYRDEGVRTIAGEAVKGTEFMEFYADEAALREIVLDLFFTQTEPAE